MSFFGEKIRRGFKGLRNRLSLRAQRLAPEELSRRQMEEEIPLSWKADGQLWGYVTKYMLKGSGAGFVTPPYTAYWERLWGATPIEDLPTYKDLYTFTPYIKAAVDVTVNLSISQGFELRGPDEAVVEWLSDWCDEHNVLQDLRIVATDMLVFGNAFLEICRNEQTGSIEWLKPLDPVHMRVRRDAYGNILGYIQLLTFPPVTFASTDIVHFRWGAKSWWYEFSYGTSLLRPLLKVQAYIDQFETDLATIIHCYTKPMLVVKAGTPEKPFSDPQLTTLMQAFQSRQAATDVFVRGDVSVEVIQSMTKDVNVQFWLNYLSVQRDAVLGVPKIYMGQSEGTNRATADVVMQEYVTRLRMIQEIIGDILETVLFRQLIEAEFGDGVEIPTVEWRPIWEPNVADKAKYVSQLVQTGILQVSEARTELGFSAQPETGGLPVVSGQDQQGEIVQKAKLEGKKGKKWLIAEVE